MRAECLAAFSKTPSMDSAVRVAAPDAVEHVEDAAALLLRDAWPPIAHVQLQTALGHTGGYVDGLARR
jgi:hypothetical protein